ncbi:MAG: glutamate-5-semialdehyde dehydrogenase [Clostridia bacterium]|nr:glutamate-5-semialdehyde dehydrogenase [Clostridia bacterium]
MTTLDIIRKAKAASAAVALCDTEKKNGALRAMARALTANTDRILDANRADVDAARGRISDVMIDRLLLTKERIESMAKGILDAASLPDPVGRIISSSTRADGLKIGKVSVPLGVVAMIYESRPNVTSDAASLAIKAGNACVLRCGKEAHGSAAAIVAALGDGLESAGLPRDAVVLVEDVSRESANVMMTARGLIDLLIPRGGAGLIKSCVENATVPCIETGTGICHVYVDRDADFEKALKIVNNAKTSRPSVCNAEEVCLIHRDILGDFLPKLDSLLVDERIAAGKIPVELRCDEEALPFAPHGVAAKDGDFDTEFLDYILAVGVVSSAEEAIEHISLHSTGHSDAIVTENADTAKLFTSRVDSAAVYVNASTRFTDGGEFGLGCEMGISTQKLHARGPMGLEELTSYKYVVTGNGNVR